MDKELEKYIQNVKFIKAEEFAYLVQVSVYLARILDRDMKPDIVDSLMPYRQYLIRAVWEAQDMARSNTACSRPPIMRRLASWFQTIIKSGRGG